MNQIPKNKKIAVGMSGGVDSSVAALMLKNAGYDVIGVTMILKPAVTAEDKAIMYKEADDASAVCKVIGIPHYVKDFREEFSNNVIEYFVNEYQNGRTPNPCIRCNFSMKFGMMMDYAQSLGCDYISTGHYAKIEKIGDEFYLKKADSIKDQSYFLYTMTQHQLAHSFFPLINKEKLETRAIATEYNLPVATKSDSQDICFIKDGDYASFIEKFTGKKAEKGDFIDINGNYLGKHNGIYRYTIGQSRGLGIALGKRQFVEKIDANTNKITLSPENSFNTYSAVVSNPHIINNYNNIENLEVSIKTRFRAKPTNATITLTNNKIYIKFAEAQKPLCPGQAAVFYKDDTVIGGGIIE